MDDGKLRITDKKGKIEFRVRYADTDRMGVVNHGRYLEYLEFGRTEFMRELGLSYAQIEAQGIGLAVVDAKIKYRASSTYDDILTVECWVKNITRNYVVFNYIIYKEDIVIIKAETTLVSIDIQKLKAVKIPENLDKILRDYLIQKN